MGEHKPTNHSTEETFRAFIDVLAAGTADLLTRMKLGHEPDEHGWCRHTTHEYHWESHPCSVLRLAQLAEINSGPPIINDQPAVATAPAISQEPIARINPVYQAARAAR